MGLFGGGSSPKMETKQGRTVYVLICNRGKCSGNRFEASSESKCKSEYHKHQRLHDKATKAKKNLKKLKDKRSDKGKCQICGKNPCSVVKPACVRQAASGLGSSMDIDLTDPAYFDPQMRNWFGD